MRILTHVAQRIVNEVTQVIDEEVILLNRKGKIIAGSDSSRIGMFHEGGLEVVQTKRKLIITPSELKRLRGVKIGLNLPIRFQDQIIGVIGITGSKLATTLHGELIQRMTELIIEEAYSAERLDSKLRGLETFVSEWLHSETISGDLMDRGDILGIDMNATRSCVLVQLDPETTEFIEVVERDVLDTMRVVFPNKQKDILVRWGRDRIVLLISTVQASDQLERALQQLVTLVEDRHSISVKIGCSRLNQTSSQLHIGYKEAKKALAVKNTNDKVTFYDTFPLEVALSEINKDTQKEITSKVLGKLKNEQELLETLQAYFDHHLSIKETAASLHIHINTLHYRLKRIQELTGYQLKETKELVTLYVALWYYYAN